MLPLEDLSMFMACAAAMGDDVVLVLLLGAVSVIHVVVTNHAEVHDLCCR